MLLGLRTLWSMVPDVALHDPSSSSKRSLVFPSAKVAPACSSSYTLELPAAVATEVILLQTWVCNFTKPFLFILAGYSLHI